jgi:sugar-specific transcriptional regulator TrmB
MSSKTTLHTYFAKLDLEPEIADIYLALQTDGPQSISQLARSTGLDRIKIYRLMDALKSSGIIEIETQYKRSVLHAAPIENIHILIAKKEQELKGLQDGFAEIASTINHAGQGLTSTRVQYYQGLDGLKQIFWNQTRSKGESFSILYENMQHQTKLSYFERWVRICNERDLRFRSIIGDTFVSTQQAWYSTHNNERLKNWQARYIPDSVFPISHSMVVYDDVVVYFSGHTDHIFGVEIHNKEIADGQRRFLNMLWQQSQPFNDIADLHK